MCIMQAVVSWSEGDFYSEEEEELIEEPPPPVENSPVCIISLKTRLIEAWSYSSARFIVSFKRRRCVCYEADGNSNLQSMIKCN